MPATRQVFLNIRNVEDIMPWLMFPLSSNVLLFTFSEKCLNLVWGVEVALSNPWLLVWALTLATSPFETLYQKRHVFKIID